MITDTQILASLYPALNAAATVDLMFWTDAELLDYADRTAERLGRKAGMFIELESTALTAADRNYTGRHYSTLHGAWNGSALRPASVRELEALDSDWVMTSGTPTRWCRDVLGTGSLTLYPVPAAGGTFEEVFHTAPEVEAGASFAAPDVFADFLFYGALAEARGRESDAAMPEVAAHCVGVRDWMAGLLQGYFGGAE